MDDYKTPTIAAYNQHAQAFADHTAPLQAHLHAELDIFAHNIPGDDVLDLGSGSGREALYFRERGLRPLCADLSPAMVALCREQGLEARVEDIENLPWKAPTFDGVLACTSLLHLPKTHFPVALAAIHTLLKPRGIFYLNMKEGTDEAFVMSDKYRDVLRFFAFYTQDELTGHLARRFTMIYNARHPFGQATFLSSLWRKSA